MSYPLDFAAAAAGKGQGDLLGEMCWNRVIEHRCRVDEVPGLLHRGLHDPWVGMTDGNADIHSEQVDVLSALVVPEVLHRAPAKHDRLPEWHEFPLGCGVIPVPPPRRSLQAPVGRDHDSNTFLISMCSSSWLLMCRRPASPASRGSRAA